MVDKLTTIPRTSVGERLGRLSEEDLLRLGRSVVVFLGIVVLTALIAGLDYVLGEAVLELFAR